MSTATLPDIADIIYYMEDHRQNASVWLNLATGHIQKLEPEFWEGHGGVGKELGSEQLGQILFPLAPWASSQGYQLMQDFARTLPEQAAQLKHQDELLKILRSRNHVFKRFKEYINDYREIKHNWIYYRQHYFLEYLQNWYQKEYPQASHLHTLLHTAISEQHSVEYSDYEELEEESQPSLFANLLHEDFELRYTVRETLQQYQSLGQAQLQRRRFLQVFSIREEIGSDIFSDIPWLNCVELHSPGGDCVAQLFWCWGGPRIPQVLHIASVEEFHSLNLENYLLDNFLQQTAPDLSSPEVEVLLNADLEKKVAETLGAYSLKDTIRLCRITL